MWKMLKVWFKFEFVVLELKEIECNNFFYILYKRLFGYNLFLFIN